MSRAAQNYKPREAYRFFTPVPTRWNDNDLLGHVNNVLYYRFFEVVIVKFLMEECKLDWFRSPILPYTAENRCRFRRPLSFPDVVEGALAIGRLGSTSITYEVALFRPGEDIPAADGDWVHVWVDRASERPVVMPEDLRAVMTRHRVSI